MDIQNKIGLIDFMAISKNPNLAGFRGTIDNTVVVRIDP